MFLISNALAQTTPTIITQPQGQTAIVGNNLTFWVTVADGSAPPLPSVSSGTLQLWLKADAGVVTNSAGLVSQWQDQSGNTNHASQPDTNNQPVLVYPPSLGGAAALRFNGVLNAVNGDFLTGTGDVGLSNALTAFAVYNTFSNVPSGFDWGAEVWLVGSLNGQDICRAFAVWQRDTLFAYGGNGAYGGNNAEAPFLIPTNTYRICTDRLNTNLSTVEMFDTSASSETNFSFAVSGLQTPPAGYSVGGVDPALQQYVNGRCFDGDIAEVIIYQGYLSDADRLAVQGYLQQKYSISDVNNTVSYQWQFDSNNISGATNATLTLSDVQTNEAGSYSVIVTNVAGSTNSSSAVLTVGSPPSITVQPSSQVVVQGTNVTFTVTASGTAPLNYQWSFDGAALAQATNSTLTLINVQSANSGSYSVVVSNSYGSVLSFKAVLSIGLLPTILTQPQSQSAPVGSNVTLAVTATAAPLLPAVSSGTLQLWLKADAGVVTNSAGLVSQWQDQSGNTNHASQPDTNSQPLLVYPAGLGGAAALRFNGVLNAVNGDFLTGTGDVGLSNALTAFAVYNTFSNVPSGFDWGAEVWLVGSLNGPGNIRAFAVWQKDMIFSYASSGGYGGGYAEAPFLIPTNTYRICTDRVNTNLSAVEMFDTSASSETNFSFAVSGLQTPPVGYSVGGVNPATAPYGYSRCFDGDIAEVLIYQGYLSDADRLDVANYLEQKYYQSSSSVSLSYQWQLDGANINGATNATMTLTNLQGAEAGTYTVIVTSLGGSVASSGAVLTPQSTVQVVSTNAVGGGTVVVSIDMNAVGTEMGVGFTLDFDPSVLSFTGVVLGSGGAGGALAVNSNQAPAGVLGLGVDLFSGTFSAGNLDLVDVSFQVLPVTNTTATSLTFGNQVTEEQIADAQAQSLPAAFLPGVVVIPTTTLEGDVSPRPNGNEVLNISDWVQEARFVAGLDTVSNGSEFQRADCAPRATLGDGQITVADWVQVGRYVVGLDPLTAVGGSTNPVSNMETPGRPVKTDDSRPVTLVPLSQGGLINSVAVKMIAQGTESALSFSVTFDPTMVRFVNAGLGSGASGAALIQNTNRAASGNVGFVVGWIPPATFAAGTLPLVQLNFASVVYSNNAVLSFSDTPVLRQLADAKANILSANYQNVTLAVGGSAWPPLSISQAIGNNIVLSWPLSAATLGLQVAPSPGGPWSDAPATTVTNGSSLVVTYPVPTNTEFFRLKH